MRIKNKTYTLDYPLEFFFHLRKNNRFDLSLKLCISDQPDLNRINLVQFYQFQYLIKLIGHMLIGPNLNRLDDLMFGKLLDNIFYILATKNEHQVLVDLLASSKWTVLSDNCQMCT